MTNQQMRKKAERLNDSAKRFFKNNDGETYFKDKKRTRKMMLGNYNQAARILLTGKRNSPEWERARKVYNELHEYIIGSGDAKGKDFGTSMFKQEPPVGKPCDECGEIIEQWGNTIGCPNGCFEDDIRNYYSFNYR